MARDGRLHVHEKATDDEFGHWQEFNLGTHLYDFQMMRAERGTVKYRWNPSTMRAMDEPQMQPRGVGKHRSRLLEGMAQAVATKGYGETTIADIVREAAVSRRTFYEHFESKAHCLVALYQVASRNALNVLRQSIDPSQPWESQVEQALSAYLACMAGNPVLMRTLFVEILNLGPEGLDARRAVNQEIADFMLKVINSDAEQRGAPRLPTWMAMAVVGGIHELVLEYIEQDKVDRLQELAGPASQLVRAVTHTEREAA